MTEPPPPAQADTRADIWADAIHAATLLALDPSLGGISLRSPPGPARDRLLAHLRTLSPGPWRKLPATIAEDRLTGGLDLAATLAAGSPRHTSGALAEAAGGTILLAMAERLPPGTAARIAQHLDEAPTPTILLDEGIDDERPPASLLDRTAIHLDLTTAIPAHVAPPDLARARSNLAAATIPDEALEALCATALALGIPSGRAPLHAARTARAAAALANRSETAPEDIALAARLVLAPRATQYPPEVAPPEPPPEQPSETPDQDPQTPAPDSGTLADQVLEAAKAAIPPGLLALLQAQAPRAKDSGRAGPPKPGTSGRPLPPRPGIPNGNLRLDLLATLRAAAPWQRLRRGAPPIQIRREDLRTTRRLQRAGTTTIFLVDASGSAALNRLAEAKGAVELLLADCYVRRDQVAVLAFRGKDATILLPPTRSLVRAKRSLAGLPGGGGTPLATGLDAATQLADAVARKGGAPTLVLLTDAQANVARDGTGGRTRAAEDATAAARRLRTARHPTLLIDTAPRPTPAARALATTMAARYLPLPYANSHTLNQSIRALR